MSVGASQPSALRFGVFELNLATGELRKGGTLIKLSPQPFKLLALIAGRSGQVVTREEIQQEIWGSGTFVDFEHGMNHCIKQIRTALGDNAETPRYVETLPRRGYRFIAPVEQLGTLAKDGETPGNTMVNELSEEAKPRPARDSAALSTAWHPERRMLTTAGLAAVAIVAATIAGAVWLGRGEKSIAVLPFADMSPDKNQDYLSDGLSEELRNGLARIEGLRVTGRTSSFLFKGKAEDFRIIGRKLNVATILEGSVRRQGSRARISLQLIKSKDGFQLWSETYDREMNDIFGVEDEIAHAVTAALKVRLLGTQTGKSPKSTNIEAYNSYLQARYFYGKRNKPDLEKAADYFARATQLDPAYAPAWAGLGRARVAQADRGYVPEKEGYRQAREAVERALSLDPDLAEAHATMGSIRKDHDWDWMGADASYRRALALAPGNASVMGGAGDLVWILGRLNEAIALYHRAIEIDPLDNNLYFNLGLILDSAGRQEEAKTAIAKALELAPEMDGAHFALCRIYLTQSKRQQALAEAQKEKHAVFRPLGLALAYYTLDHKESDANLAELTAKFTADNPYQIADVYAFRGETDKAFEWLDQAYSARDPGLIEIKGDPLLNNLKHDPRYSALLKKMHLAP